MNESILVNNIKIHKSPFQLFMSSTKLFDKFDLKTYFTVITGRFMSPLFTDVIRRIIGMVVHIRDRRTGRIGGHGFRGFHGISVMFVTAKL